MLGTLLGLCLAGTFLLQLGVSTPAEAANTVPSFGGYATRAPGSQTVRRYFDGRRDSLRVAVAGVVTRNAPPAPPWTEGTITLPDGPQSENIVWAGLYWVILGNQPPRFVPQLNGHDVYAVGLPIRTTPCYPEIQHSYAFFADVTAFVLAGANTVRYLDDAGPPPDFGYQSEGASLVVVYRARDSRACAIIILDGNDVTDYDHRAWETAFDPGWLICGAPVNGILYIIGGDGQRGADGDDELWNDMPLGDHDDFDSSDPLSPGAYPGGWDSDRWEVTVEQTNTAAVRNPPPPGLGDCIDWIATVLEVKVEDNNPTRTRSTSWGRLRSIYR